MATKQKGTINQQTKGVEAQRAKGVEAQRAKGVEAQRAKGGEAQRAKGGEAQRAKGVDQYIHVYQRLLGKMEELSDSDLVDCIEEFYTIAARHTDSVFTEKSRKGIESLSFAEKKKALTTLCRKLVNIDYTETTRKGMNPKLANLMFMKMNILTQVSFT